MSAPLSVGVLLSGSGRTFENFLVEREAGRLPIDVRCVLSSHAQVRGVAIAKAHGLSTQICRRRDVSDAREYGLRIAEALEEHGVQLAVMAGFLHLWELPPAWQDRVLNIHPSLLPAFGGKGFYGSNVHRAVFDAGVKVTGCTVHFADNEYDCGPIVLQRCVPIAEDDDPTRIAAKVFEQECLAYPQALRWFAEGRIRREGRKVRILSR